MGLKQKCCISQPIPYHSYNSPNNTINSNFNYSFDLNPAIYHENIARSSRFIRRNAFVVSSSRFAIWMLRAVGFKIQYISFVIRDLLVRSESYKCFRRAADWNVMERSCLKRLDYTPKMDSISSHINNTLIFSSGVTLFKK